MSHKPVIPWIGGKRRLAKHILPLFEAHHTYVEPFCGGAAIFFLKPQSPVEVINDINGDVVNLYRVIQNHLEEFLRQFKWILVSREEYARRQQERPQTLTDIQRAASFYYKQRLAFGAKVSGQSFAACASTPPRMNLLRLEEDLSQAHLRLSRVYIERLDWQECVTRYDRDSTLFYLDPPYLRTEGYGVDFPLREYERMAEMARLVKGKMIITLNDLPEIRELFAGLAVQPVRIKYTVAAKGSTEASELIIRNFPV